MSTFDRIAHVLVDHLGVVSSRVTPGTRLNELRFDSLDWPEFWIEIESEFGFDVDDNCSAFRKVGTLGELAEAIDTLKSARAA